MKLGLIHEKSSITVCHHLHITALALKTKIPSTYLPFNTAPFPLLSGALLSPGLPQDVPDALGVISKWKWLRTTQDLPLSGRASCGCPQRPEGVPDVPQRDPAGRPELPRVQDPQDPATGQTAYLEPPYTGSAQPPKPVCSLQTPLIGRKKKVKKKELVVVISRLAATARLQVQQQHLRFATCCCYRCYRYSLRGRYATHCQARRAGRTEASRRAAPAGRELGVAGLHMSPSQKHIWPVPLPSIIQTWSTMKRLICNCDVQVLRTVS